jgi:hypothetical protein
MLVHPEKYAKIIWMSLDACKKALTCRKNLQTGFFEKKRDFDAIAASKIAAWNLSP